MLALAVKLEGGREVAEHIKAVTNASIPVVAHLGLTPQSLNAFGGFKVQGKTEAAAKKLLEDAQIVEEAGAAAVVLECVPAKLAKLVTEKLQHWRGGRLRRAGAGISGYAVHVRRFQAKICQTVWGCRRSDERSFPEIQRGSKSRHIPRTGTHF